MTKSVIVTCVPTGGVHTRGRSPHLPVTPEKVAEASIEAARAGTASIHLLPHLPTIAEQVPAIRGTVESLGHHIATRAQARERLRLEGGDHVAC